MGGRKWFGLVASSVAVAMVIVDVTIVNVAAPAIIIDLGLNDSTIQWVQTTYTLTVSGLLIVAGRIGDIHGRRKTLVVGIIVFSGGSALAAMSTDGLMLVSARFVQGVGGAAILPATLSLINADFRGKERATAFAVWGSTVGGIAAVGPLLGGWLTSESSWRWAFWINLGLGAIAIVGALAFLDESRDKSARLGLDPLGILLAAIAPSALVFGLVEGRSLGWWTASPEAWASVGPYSVIPFVLMGACTSAVAFIAWERRRSRLGEAALVDLSLLEVPAFRRGNLIVLVVALGQIGMLFVLPLWLQSALGYSALDTGLLLVALAVGAFTAAGTTPLLAGRWGEAWILRVGLVAEIAALCVLAVTLSPSNSALGLGAVLFVYGFGIGTAEAQLPGVILADVPVDDGGQAAGIQGTAQELGSALGVAVLGTVLLSFTASDLSERLALQNMPSAEVVTIVATVRDSAGAVIPGLRDPVVASAARDSLTHGATAAAYGGAAALLLGLLATAALPGRPPNKLDVEVEPAAESSGHNEGSLHGP